MDYIKRNNSPSVKTPGIYPQVDNDLVGLNSSDLEDFSLGNWNSIYKGNKLLLSGELLKEMKDVTGIKVRVKTPLKAGTRVIVWRYKRNLETKFYTEKFTNIKKPLMHFFIQRYDEAY